jgi:hypothetical protein
VLTADTVEAVIPRQQWNHGRPDREVLALERQSTGLPTIFTPAIRLIKAQQIPISRRHEDLPLLLTVHSVNSCLNSESQLGLS